MARDSWKTMVLSVVLEVYPGEQALMVLPLLLVDCSGRAEALVAVAQVVMVVQVVQVVVVQVAVVARVAAAHTRPAMVALAAMAGHWYWSFDHAAICSC